MLDGQQRITSLYAAYRGAKIKKTGEKKETNYSEIYVNLELNTDTDERIITETIPTNAQYISLHEVLNSVDNFDKIQKNFEQEYIKKIMVYNKIFDSYDFSTIVLKKDDIASAIEVFTRINTGGQNLTLFEIMSAKTYDESQNFDMVTKFMDFVAKLEDINFGAISGTVILHSLSLVLSEQKECSRKVILNLEKQDLIDTWDKIIDALEEAISYMQGKYKIPVSGLLPYDSILVPFTYFFYTTKEVKNNEQAKLLEEFFWRIALARRYASSAETALTQDIKRIDKIIAGERPNYNDVRIDINLDTTEDIINTNFRAGSSLCKAILCIFASFDPVDFDSGLKVTLNNSYLKKANSKNFHHFFPRSFLASKKIKNENSLVNITLISDKLNKGEIKAKAPSNYISAFIKKDPNVANYLKSHLIDNINDFGVLEDNYDQFLEKRAERILEELRKRINP